MGVVIDGKSNLIINGKHLQQNTPPPTVQVWTPTLTWSGGTPSVGVNDGQYFVDGPLVFFAVNIFSGNSKGVTDLTLTLPITPSALINRVVVATQEGYGFGGNTYKDPLASIAAANPVLSFKSFAAGTSGQILRLTTTGFYAIDV